MKAYQIRTKNGQLLYRGLFESFKACLEHAIKNHVKLQAADLSRKNLSCAHMDNAWLPDADFSGANLTGANLSESNLRGANFADATLCNTCLASADLQNCRFENALFGATDITDTDLSYARFSGQSCFALDFIHSRTMTGCLYKSPTGIISQMSAAPVVIKGLDKMIVFFDEHTRVGMDTFRYREWLACIKASPLVKSQKSTLN